MTEVRSGWDVFISYASEDREAVAAPLAERLQHLGMRVWFDKTELKVGDSLRERIDHGLAESRFGIVILSEAFFRKHWPTRELNGLAQREVEGQKVILPVWHGLDEKAVRAFSPPLADRVALSWAKGVNAIVLELTEVIRPDLSQSLRERARRLVVLSQVQSGKELAELVTGTHGFEFFNESISTRAESERVASFVQQLQDWGDVWGDLDAGQHIEAQFSMHESLTELRGLDWSVFGARGKRKVKFAGGVSDWDVALVAIINGNPPVVFVDGDRAIVPRAPARAV